MLRIATIALVLFATVFSASADELGRPDKAETGRIIVENSSRVDIHVVRFSPVADDEWGSDRLGAEEIIVSGAQRSWSVPAGRYHIMVEMADGEEMDSLEEYVVLAGGSTTCAIEPVEGGAPAPSPAAGR